MSSLEGDNMQFESHWGTKVGRVDQISAVGVLYGPRMDLWRELVLYNPRKQPSYHWWT